MNKSVQRVVAKNRYGHSRDKRKRDLPISGGEEQSGGTCAAKVLQLFKMSVTVK